MKKYYLAIQLLCLIIGLLIFSNTQAQFREKYNSGFVSRDIKGMSFITPSTGFVAFTNYIGFTQDSGQSYTPRYINAANTDFNGYSVNLTLGFIARGVHAFTADSLFVYGNFTAAPAILFSANQGVTWKLVNLRPVTSDIYNNIFDLKFPANGNTGIAVNHNEILRSTNRGQTWTVAVSGLTGKERLSFPSALTGYAIGGYTLMKTTNGGSGWNQTNMPTGTTSSSDFNNVFFTNDNVGYITENIIYQFWKTINGGSTWTKMNNEALIPISGSDLQFINDSTAFMCKPYEYQVYKTTDSGKVWEPCKKNSNYNYLGYGFTRLHFNNSIGWAGGAGEYLMIASPGVPVFPKSFFKIDTVNYYQAGVVKLQSATKPAYQHTWYKNDTLISTSVNTTYTRGYYPTIDTIKLIVSNGIDADTSIQYQYFNPPGTVPVINSIFPNSGGPMEMITINGNNFTGVNSVTFGGLPAAFVNPVNNTTLTAYVNVNGASGDVVVTKPFTPSGVLPGGFTFTPIPVITNCSPLAGPVGSTVTITGSLFGASPAANTVYFGSVKASVLSASPTQLTVAVPTGATYSQISVMVNGITGFAPQFFNVTYPGGQITQFSQPSRIDISAATQPKNAAIADFDGDGKPDVVIPNKTSNSVFVYRNTSTTDSIILATPVSLAGVISNPMRAVAGDLDRDGKLDILVTCLIGSNGNKVAWFRNTSIPGIINFAAPMFVSTSTNFNYENPESLVAEDLDVNGKVDFINANVHDYTISIHLNRFGGSIYNALVRFDLSGGDRPTGLAVKDLDGDGKPELIRAIYAPYFSGRFFIYRNTTNLSYNSIGFDAAVQFDGPKAPMHISVADLDGDGKSDIIIADSLSGKIFLYRNLSVLGTVTLAPGIEIFSGTKAFATAIGDINGDGKADIAVSNRGDNTVSVFINTGSVGNISFAPVMSFAVGSAPEGLSIVDLNDDKRPEIITTNNSGNNFSILYWPLSTTHLVCPPGNSTTIAGNITGTAYQWQADTGAGFGNISDNANYTGTNTGTLQLTGISNTWTGYKFRCIADGNTGQEFTLKFGNLWTGALNNAWENPANWSCNTVPDATTDVIINSGFVILNSNVTIRSLALNPSAIFRVNTGYNLVILY